MAKLRLSLLKNSIACTVLFTFLAGFTSIAKSESAKPTASASEVQSNRQAASSADTNEVISMLYQWWGLFEAPDSSKVLDRFDDIFAEDVYLKIGDMEIDGLAKLKSIFAAIPPRQLSHHQPEIKVLSIGDEQFEISADFLYQAMPQGEETSTGKTHYQHTLKRSENGNLVFTKLTGHIIEPLANREFQPSYLDNRIRATIIRYIGITDKLDSEYQKLSEIMTKETEVIGMFDPTKATFNDRGDGVLRGIEEIAGWLGSRKNTLSAVAHRLSELDVSMLGDDRYEAAVTVATQAWPKNGEKIDVLVPVKIILKEQGQRLMTIESIRR